jgi:hypothetical protein
MQRDAHGRGDFVNTSAVMITSGRCLFALSIVFVSACAPHQHVGYLLELVRSAQCDRSCDALLADYVRSHFEHDGVQAWHVDCNVCTTVLSGLGMY